jgi:hypothetical protein
MNFWKKKTVVPVETGEEETIDFKSLSEEERRKYIESQCETIRDCKRLIQDAKNEYNMVSSYFSDIQLIETLPQEQRETIGNLAKQISDLSVDRRVYMAEESRISPERYRQMARYEDEIVEGMKKLQNDESYLQVVKRDMNVLEGEKTSLRMTAQELVQRQEVLQKLSIASMIIFGVLFLVMILLGLNTSSDISMGFFVILLFAAMFLAIEAAVYSRTIHDIQLTERKLKRAVTLLNRVKIKFLNTTNLVEYQREKYNVKNAYELSEQYQLYLEVKKQKENYRNATLELSELEEQLVSALTALSLFDPQIWLGQVRALYDQKEMVEIRHGYSVRRQKLRAQIEDAQERGTMASGILQEIGRQYPSMQSEIMVIKDHYAQ